MRNKGITVLSWTIAVTMLTTISGPTVTWAEYTCPPPCECNENDNQEFLVRCHGVSSMSDISANTLPVMTSSLDVSGNKLTLLKTSTFYNIRSLKTLNVSHNLIESSEDGTFGFMRLLQTLDLSWNQLTVIRQGTFHGARSMQELHLSNNRLKGMSGAFDGMKDLTTLDLSDNLLTSISELLFRDVTNLRYLYLSNNRIQHIDRRAFRTLHKLLYLVLKGNPLDDHVTRFQFNSIYLSYLDLSECGLKQVPRGLGDSIRYLQLRRNNITQLNMQSFQDCPYINILVLDENQIHSIEDGTFERMIHLRQLWLTDNQLQDIPRPLPVGLRRLLLDSNKIDEIINIFPQGSHIDTMSLVDNEIKRVSVDAFSNLRALHSLDLSNNRINKIESQMFAQNSELRTMHLNMNPLRQFNSESFAGLSGLRILSLSYLFAPSNEGEFNEYNRQTPPEKFSVPEDIFQPLTSLTSLDLDSSGDLIAVVLSSDVILGSLHRLQEISLRNSELTALRADFPVFFPMLSTMRISSNRWHCDTSLMWFRDFILTSGVKIENKEDIKCFTPRPVHSHHLISLKDSEFALKTTTMTSHLPIIQSNVVVTTPSVEYQENLSRKEPLANNRVTSATVFNQEGWRDYEVEPARHLVYEDEIHELFVQSIRRTTTEKNRANNEDLVDEINKLDSEFDEKRYIKEDEQQLQLETVTEKSKKTGVRKKPGVLMPPLDNGNKKSINSNDVPEFVGAVKDDDVIDGKDDYNDDPFRYRIVAVTLIIALTIVIACAIIAIIICVWSKKQKNRHVHASESASMLPQHTVIKYKNKNGVLYFSSANRSPGPSLRDQDSGAHSPSSQPTTPSSVMTSSSSMPDVHVTSPSRKIYNPPVYKR